MIDVFASEPSSPKGSPRPRSWPDHARALVRASLPWLLPVMALLLIRCAHRVADPPGLSVQQLEQLARAARRELEHGGSSTADAALGIAATNPVFVTVYGPDAASRTSPVVGRWLPTREEPSLDLEAATLRAARVAAQRLAELGRPTRGTTIKVDVAGPSRRLWLRLPLSSRWLYNPGRDGWHGWSKGAHAHRLPSWEVERGEGAAEAIQALRSELGGSTRVGRFRTTSFVLLPERDIPQRLLRGNVLVEEVTAARVGEALRSAGRYLARSVRGDGSYCYEYLPREDRCSAAYNLLRHAGTTYSLYQIHRRFPDPRLSAAAERAIEWLRKHIRPVSGDRSRAYLLEGNKAKLGAAGLALIALVERERAVGDGADREVMTRLADFIISQQREDGYFASFFDWGEGAMVPRRNSIYYPGEALLGLIRLYRLDPQPRFLAASQRGAEFLVRHRWRWGGVQVQVPPDAWLTQAVAELDELTPEPWLRDYAYEIVRGTVQTMLRAEEGSEPDLVGAPSGGFALPRTTPAGSRSEGLTAAWRMAERRGQRDRVEWLVKASIRAARFQLNQQYRVENSFYLPHPDRVFGGFRETPIDATIRIDTVQHNATGLLGAFEILTGAPK